MALVVPVRGKDDVLKACLEAMSIAVQACPQARLILVDNNVSDETEAIRRLAPLAQVLRATAPTVGAVRNCGANAAPDVSVFAFVDCDCLVRPDFCSEVLRVFASTDATIVGCKVVSPKDGHWTEIAMDQVHRKGGDGYRDHMNSGCLAIRADSFRSINGFDPTLPSNEDYDLCERVRKRGGRIWQTEVLRVTHLGNPKSVTGYFNRLTWHGRGVISATGAIDWSPVLILTLMNSVLLAIASVVCVWLLSVARPWSALGLAVIALSAVPAVFVALRMLQLRRWIPPISALALMQLTFLARQRGFYQRLRELRAQRSSR
jgi:glycosyltransferase involved in cell wall biosynthesis